MLRQLIPAMRIALALTVLTGLLYPGAATGLCQLLFKQQANGSMTVKDGKTVGSGLIGQSFTRPEYFHPRPSAAGADGYDASSSGGSNLGPTSAKLIRGTTKLDDRGRKTVDYDGISLRIVHYCLENGIPYRSSMPLELFRDADGNLDDVRLIEAFNNERSPLTFAPQIPIPSDAATASGSGLDPHISPANAALQAERVARGRGVPLEQVHQLIAQTVEAPSFGILGDPRVNVLRLNLSLDRHFGSPADTARELR